MQSLKLPRNMILKFQSLLQKHTLLFANNNKEIYLSSAVIDIRSINFPSRHTKSEKPNSTEEVRRITANIYHISMLLDYILAMPLCHLCNYTFI